MSKDCTPSTVVYDTDQDGHPQQGCTSCSIPFLARYSTDAKDRETTSSAVYSINGRYHVEEPESDIIREGLPDSNGTPSRWLGATCREGSQAAQDMASSLMVFNWMLTWAQRCLVPSQQMALSQSTAS